MVTSSNIDSKTLNQLNLDALPKITKKAFLQCASLPFFSSSKWYLAGGTALALQVGHRQSVDLNFFTPEKSFNEKKIEETLNTNGEWETSSLDHGTVYGEFNGAKMSLIAYPFFRPTDFLKVGTISVITPADIAVMKIIAISQRGKKRDFIDLYWISKNIQPLEKSLELVDSQYTVRQNPNHILKSLIYFEDAEDDPMPKLFFNANWREIKKYFQTEVSRITKKLIGLK